MPVEVIKGELLPVPVGRGAASGVECSEQLAWANEVQAMVEDMITSSEDYGK